MKLPIFRNQREKKQLTENQTQNLNNSRYVILKIRGRARQYTTIASKAAVMDVISFLHVSPGSSLGGRRAWACQSLVSAVKMATVLEEYITEERRSVVHLL